MSQSDGDEKRFRESERRITSQSGYTLSYDGFPDSENAIYRLWRDGEREPFLTFKSISEAALSSRSKNPPWQLLFYLGREGLLVKC